MGKVVIDFLAMFIAVFIASSIADAFLKRCKIKVKLMEGGRIPEFKSEGAVAMDCYARLQKDLIIMPRMRETVPLGFAMELPVRYELQIRPRSGFSKKGFDVSLGTGDEDYTGEYCATITNNSKERLVIHDGDRICQCAVREVPRIKLVQVDVLKETERGDQGFGSSGVN